MVQPTMIRLSLPPAVERRIFSKPRLVPVSGVEWEAGSFNATSDLPWLRVELDGAMPTDQWVRLTFLASLLDPLCRPLLRFITAEGNKDAILPGALLGRSIWLGKVPRATQEIWISPTNRRGRFGFAIEKLETIPRFLLAASCFARNPKRCLIAFAARAAGLHFLADLQIYRALSPTPLSGYEAWRQKRLRPLDIVNLDTPRFDWTKGPCIVFVIDSAEQTPASVLERLAAQPYPNWRLIVLDRTRRSGVNSLEQERMSVAYGDESVADVLASLPADTLLAGLPANSESPAYAVGVLAETAMREPDTDIFYGDEELRDAHGSASAALKPDWSPRFQATRHYLGMALLFRSRALSRLPLATKASALLDDSETIVGELLARGCEVDHVRRILLTRQAPAAQASNPQRPHAQVPPTEPSRFTIILPTRDRIDLLQSCVKSLQAAAMNDDTEVIIVDNGSVEPDTIRFLSALTRDQRFRVLKCPGPFNFSALCNEAAKEATAPVLLFLNNDCQFLPETRIDRMLSLAKKPDVGAVGAKLLYPNGTVQHGGVVLGTDGYASHFERGLGRDDSGYFGRLNVTHEVSAVTAACLAVEKQKFDAIGGFDAARLPIEFNDIDLCLRLSARGWISLCACECVLIHHESETRSSTLRPDALYRAEHDYIHRRWINTLRDDPYFHPALSLERLDACLG